MKQVKVSQKQAQILAAAQNKTAQLNALAQEASAQLNAILELVADSIGVNVGDLLSVNATTNEVTVAEASDRSAPQASPAEEEAPVGPAEATA